MRLYCGYLHKLSDLLGYTWHTIWSPCFSKPVIDVWNRSSRGHCCGCCLNRGLWLSAFQKLSKDCLISGWVEDLRSCSSRSEVFLKDRTPGQFNLDLWWLNANNWSHACQWTNPADEFLQTEKPQSTSVFYGCRIISAEERNKSQGCRVKLNFHWSSSLSALSDNLAIYEGLQWLQPCLYTLKNGLIIRDNLQRQL
jgi:hypothetical protein